ncbi:LysM peptidoglycan-binding domain-containing protein [Sporosarcina sp. ANT_H38]|uniref:C40 family peptidase n=1 Tax=Sporosarcina sp. ANT_H38 TaxID=2597358 RepID=UPI0011F2E8C3|nr:C40 family peptidase [Sporosarcina sp. ANT_H38]KAA0966842.1 LysM peptidoglycan-binding domain-containing protein [Sporosarcina sp. ANT_H38]
MKKKVFSVLATFTLATFIFVGSAEAATKSYTVKPGDTLWKIATKHKLTVEELKSLNSLASDSIKTNQKLAVSLKGMVSQKPGTVNSSPSKTVNKKVVTVIKETSSTNSWKNAVATTAKPTEPTLTSNKILLNAVDISLPLLGTPYVWAGVNKEGFDCSGFINYVFSEAGLDMPRLDTIGMHSNSFSVDEPIPGDLVFFENTYRSGISHAGIYLGEGNFIHAATEKVEISSINSVYWKDKFTGFKRFNQLN